MSRNEVAELSEVELICLVQLQLGTLDSRSVAPKVNELDGRSGMKYSAMKKRLSRNEVVELSEAESIRLIHFQMGSPWFRSVDPKVHESDGSPHDGELLLVNEWTEICLSCLKDFEEEVVWQAFTKFDMLGKVIRAEWDSSSPLGEII